MSCSGNPTRVHRSEITVVVTVSVLGLLLLVILIPFFIFKKRKGNRRASEATHGDINPIYGYYFDPDPRTEVEDSNDNYSSDYEAGTGRSRATDNNPYYE